MFKVGDIIVRTYANAARPELIVGKKYEVVGTSGRDRVMLKGISVRADASLFELDKNTIVINILNDL